MKAGMGIMGLLMAQVFLHRRIVLIQVMLLIFLMELILGYQSRTALASILVIQLLYQPGFTKQESAVLVVAKATLLPKIAMLTPTA